LKYGQDVDTDPPEGYGLEERPLDVKITTEGEGPLIGDRDTVYVHYRGQLESGLMFDFSRNNMRHSDFHKYTQDQMPPIRVVMHANELVPGFVQALKQLKKGSIADAIIPPSLGYGGKTLEKIPVYSYLEFKLEVIDVVHEGEFDEIADRLFKEQMAEIEAKQKHQEMLDRRANEEEFE